ncbi:glycoside hydrolase family 15 protein [Streptacidiphilus rugosus]|uniref:glycoside hydrolase family 15 protein n=1 Tax=Streptacidiphilus rugosus TaxID=405783 RepID=UPI000AE0077F|nr:glycoside hydrolase family 15 protein [Streptacidiphilus rugosus]
MRKLFRPSGRRERGWAFSPHVLRQYALLADGERGALIGPEGDVSWLCVPRWDSPAVFSELIGGGGVFAITPRDPRHFWGGWYETGTLIWHSRWVTTDSVIECREALCFPGDQDRAVLLRRIEAVEGVARVRLLIEPSGDFGRASAGPPRRSHGLWSGRTGPVHWRLTGGQGAAPRRRPYGKPLVWDLDLRPGRHHDVVLELAAGSLPARPPDPDAAWRATESAWSEAQPALDGAIAPRDAHHAYSVMRGLTAGSGAMVAAATMCLPEQAEGQRNYDYRYAWIRDQCYAGLAAAAAGATELVDAATSFVGARLLQDGPEMRPAYTVTGGDVPDERSLDLPGYPGAADRIGNRAHRQHQLDAFGEALQLLAATARLDRLDADGARALDLAVDAIAHHWNEPEAGIWEIEPRRWTHSRLACVAGLRAAAALPGSPRRAARCSALADAILARTSGEALHLDGYWQRAPGDPRPDAALLLPPVRGALPADDPRTEATLRAVSMQLVEDGFVYRFRHDQNPLGDAEGAFLLCGFTMALAQHHQGHHATAARYFERNRAACGPPGLFAEEYDTAERQLRGNLPQAFVHALLLESAVRLGQDPGLHLGTGPER